IHPLACVSAPACGSKVMRPLTTYRSATSPSGSRGPENLMAVMSRHYRRYGYPLLVPLTSSQRNRRNVGLFLRFAAVGASGVLVNLLVLIVLKRLGPGVEELFLSLPMTRFNVRWYHVFSTGAFVVAILWNFQLNRGWTFHTAGAAPWWSE